MQDYSNFFVNSNCRLDNLELEEKKIIAAHNAYLHHLKKYYDDGGWHNLRAYLINRVEELTNYRLIVTWDDDNIYAFSPNIKIQDRKTYLKEKYDFNWKEPQNID